jgi:hypothetical protein
MKIAVLISGEPRFCEEFDQQLSQYTDYDTIDWYFFLWQNNTAPHHTGIEVVSPFWQTIDEVSARQKLETNLPANNRLAKISVVDKDDYKINFEPKNKSSETNAENTWLKFNGFYRVNQLLKSSTKNYDLVVMTRPDICLENKLSFKYIKHELDRSPDLVMTPNNWAHGYGRKICDNFAISKPNIMDVYCNLINYIPEFQKEGFIFHPETMLAEHLFRNNIEIVKGEFSMQLRNLGKRDPVKHYISNFGRWV